MRITDEGWTKKNTNYNLMINTSSRVLDKKNVSYIEYEI